LNRLVATAIVFICGCASSNRADAPLSEQKDRSAETRPNILIILGDDLGPQLHCYGDSIARTPHFDRLAQEGARFTNAYVTQASCSPSRASFLTGLYPHQHGQIGLAPGFSMRAGVRTLPRMLKEAGYRTGCIGKVHVLPDSAFAFDFVNEMKDEGEEEEPPVLEEGERPQRINRRSKDVGAVAALVGEFLEKDRARPFFLLLSYADPHRPFEDQVAGIPPNPHTAADVRPLPFLGIDTPAMRQSAAGYYNSVERLDHGVGLTLDALAGTGLDRTTIVIALGDQGPPFARSKGTCYEAGIKVPLLIRWPGQVPQGRVSDAFVTTLDLMPTILEWTGCEAPSGLEGKSLAPLLAEKSTAPASFREYVFSEFNFHGKLGRYPRRAVRDERYKLILNLEPERRNPFKEIDADVTWSESRRPEFEGTEIRRVYDEFASPPAVELYDLANDPWETKNLAADGSAQENREQLAQILNAWRKDHGDTLADFREKKP
jgi:N-sulfoglucosamine sulfohydrolase